MKRKTLRKAGAVAAAAVMAMGTLAGCGSSNTAERTAAAETTESTASSEAAESTAAGETTETASTSTGGGMDSWEPFAENVTLQVPVYDRGVEGVPDVVDNYWTPVDSGEFRRSVEYYRGIRSDHPERCYDGLCTACIFGNASHHADGV